MVTLALLLAAATLAHAASRAVGAPTIPFLLLGGVLLARLPFLAGDLLVDALVLGVTFLLFVAGLELDPSRTRAQRGAALRVGVLQYLVLAALGFAAASALGFSPLEAAYLALALAASSTLVGVRILQRRRQMFEPFGRLVLGVLLLQDVLVLLSIPLVIGIATGPGAAVTSLVGIVVLGALSLGVRRVIGPAILRAMDDPELLLLAPLVILFALLLASDALGLPLVVGAFAAGFGLSSFPVGGVVRSYLLSIGDFFAAVFFVALGAIIPLPTVEEALQAAALTLLILVVTPPLVAFIAERNGFAARSSLEAGLLLSQTSEISLVVGLTGVLQGVLTPPAFTVIATVTLVTMLLTPLVATDEVAHRLLRFHPSLGRDPGPPRSLEDHVLLLGAGSTGMPLVENLVVAGCPLAVVEDDPAVIEELERAGIPAVRGDASDPGVLERAGASRATAVAALLHRARDAEAVLTAAGPVPVLVRVFEDSDAAWVRERGGIPILFSEAAADAVLAWWDEEGPDPDVPAVGEGRPRRGDS